MQSCLPDLGQLQTGLEAWGHEELRVSTCAESRPLEDSFTRGDIVDEEERAAFDQYILKVTPCPKRFIHDWSTCPFAHPSERARRRCPRTFNYTGIACLSMKQHGFCPLGDKCSMAHSAFEYWLHPTRYHTALCKQGASCQRKICFFAHHPSELRTPAEKPGASLATHPLAAQSAAAVAAAAPPPALLQSGSPSCSTRSASSSSSNSFSGLQGLLGADAGGMEHSSSFGSPLQQLAGLSMPGAGAGSSPDSSLLDLHGGRWVPSPPPPPMQPTPAGLAGFQLAGFPVVCPPGPQRSFPSGPRNGFTDDTARALVQAVAEEVAQSRMDSSTAASIITSVLPVAGAQPAAAQAPRSLVDQLALALACQVGQGGAPASAPGGW